MPLARTEGQAQPDAALSRVSRPVAHLGGRSPYTHGVDPNIVTAASRLRQILEAARALPGETPAAEGWARALQVPNEPARTLHALAEFSELVEFTCDAVTQLEHGDVVGPTLDEIRQVRDSLVRFSGSMDETLKPLTKGGVAGLQFAHSLMKGPLREIELSTAQRDDLTARVEDVLLLIESSTDLDEAEKLVVLSHVKEIRAVLQRVQVAGVAKLQAAADATLGAVLNRPSLFAKLRENRGLQAVIQTVIAIDLILNTAANVLALTQHEHTPSITVIQVLEEGNVIMLEDGVITIESKISDDEPER